MGENAEGLDSSDIAGFGAEIALDPLTFFGGFIGKLLGKGASRLGGSLTRFAEGASGLGRAGGLAGRAGEGLAALGEKAGALGVLGGAAAGGTAGFLAAPEDEGLGGALLGAALGGLGTGVLKGAPTIAEGGLSLAESLSKGFKARTLGRKGAEELIDFGGRGQAKFENAMFQNSVRQQEWDDLLREVGEEAATKYTGHGEVIGFRELVGRRAGLDEDLLTVGGGSVPLGAFEEGTEEALAKALGIRVDEITEAQKFILSKGGKENVAAINAQIDALPPQVKQIYDEYFVGSDKFPLLIGKIKGEALQAEAGFLHRAQVDEFMQRTGVAQLPHVLGAQNADEVLSGLIGALVGEAPADVLANLPKFITEARGVARSVFGEARKGRQARKLAGQIEEINRQFPGLLEENLAKLGTTDARRLAARLTASDMVDGVLDDAEWSLGLIANDGTMNKDVLERVMAGELVPIPKTFAMNATQRGKIIQGTAVNAEARAALVQQLDDALNRVGEETLGQRAVADVAEQRLRKAGKAKTQLDADLDAIRSGFRGEDVAALDLAETAVGLKKAEAALDRVEKRLSELTDVQTHQPASLSRPQLKRIQKEVIADADRRGLAGLQRENFIRAQTQARVPAHQADATAAQSARLNRIQATKRAIFRAKQTQHAADRARAAALMQSVVDDFGVGARTEGAILSAAQGVGKQVDLGAPFSEVAAARGAVTRGKQVRSERAREIAKLRTQLTEGGQIPKFMPKPVWDELFGEGGVATRLISPKTPGRFANFWKKINKQWVGWTLGPFVGWWSRNLVGNEWNNFLTLGHRAFTPTVIRKGMRLQNDIAEYMTGRAHTLDAAARTAVEEAIEDGVIASGFYTTEAGREVLRALSAQQAVRRTKDGLLHPKSTLRDMLAFDPQQNTFSRAGFGINGILEDNARIRHYLAKRAQHADPKSVAARQEARISMTKSLGDFRNLGEGVEAAAQVMPFFRWTAFNIPRQIRAFAEAPQRVAMVGRTVINLDHQGRADIPEGVIPEWLQGQLAVPVSRKDGAIKIFALNRWLPLADLTEIDSPKKFAQFMVNSLTPFLGEPLEQALNFDTFFQKAIENYPGEQEHLFGIPLSRRSTHMLRNVRILNEFDRSWGPILGLTPASARLQTELQELTGGEALLRGATGLKARKFSLPELKRRRIKSLKSQIGRMKSSLRRARRDGGPTSVIQGRITNLRGQLQMIRGWQPETHPLIAQDR